ncbi:MAG: dockerin type I repeat-containing protein, partial [Candidatus Avispirillum sp.]
MKKLTAAVLAAAALLTACTLFAVPGGASLYERGDINGDGSVNAMDAYYLKRVCAGTTLSSELYGTDINCDGKVNATDIFYLKRCLVGSAVLSELFPEGTGWQGFTVAGSSVDGFEIVVTDTGNDNMCFAAEELAKYVKEGDGSTLSIVDTAG